MYARIVSMHVKANGAAEFTRTLEHEVLPLLRKQPGFQGEVAFLSPGDKEAIGISLWDTEENASNYNRSGYAQVLKTLEKVTQGASQVQNYEVSTSTFANIGARANAGASATARS